MSSAPVLRYLAAPVNGTVGCYPLGALSSAMDGFGFSALENHLSRADEYFCKAVCKLRLPRNIARSNSGPVFVALMGFSEYRTYPFSLWTEIVPYCFDCWPSDYGRWLSFFRRHRVRLAFFTARQSAEHFARELPEMRSVWLPEATDPRDYYAAIPLQSRTIDVLELGRKHENFHTIIAARLSPTGRVHLFEQSKGRIIFPDRHSLVEGLANSKVSVCFPCSQTHPDRSGQIETVTHRYFESIASKCILLGHSPEELRELFGYNPVVEVESGNEVEQLESILANVSGYSDLIERNYARLLEIGTWDSRVPTIMHHLSQVFGVALQTERIESAPAA